MKKYYIYMVKCSDDSIYTGITNNLEKQISEHNLSINTKAYTFSRRPVILILMKLLLLKNKLKDGRERKRWH